MLVHKKQSYFCLPNGTGPQVRGKIKEKLQYFYTSLLHYLTINLLRILSTYSPSSNVLISFVSSVILYKG